MMYGKGSIVLCATCGTAATAQSDFSHSIVCNRCQTVNYKFGDLSKMVTAIPEDMSVLQIGSEGAVDHKEFKVIGRYKIDTESEYYNFWVIHFKKDDILEWLIESYGGYFYASTRKLKTENFSQKMWLSYADYMFDLDSLGEYRLINKPKLLNLYWEGELPDTPENIRVTELLEFAKNDGSANAFLFKEEGKKITVIEGAAKEWNDLHLTHVRKPASLV